MELFKENLILTNAFSTIDWVSIVTKNTVFTVRALSKVGTWLVTDTTIGRAYAVSVTLACWWTEAEHKSNTVTSIHNTISCINHICLSS
jgi:hypothetical protein